MRAAQDWHALRQPSWVDVHSSVRDRLANTPLPTGWSNQDGGVTARMNVNGRAFELQPYRIIPHTFSYISLRRADTNPGKESVTSKELGWNYDFLGNNILPTPPHTVAAMIQLWNQAPLLIRLPDISTITHCECRGLQQTSPEWRKARGLNEGSNTVKMTASSITPFTNEWTLSADLDQRQYRAILEVDKDNQIISECVFRSFTDKDVLADMRREYSKASGKAEEWANGPFADTFPELFALLRDLSDLNLSQADRYIEVQRRQAAPPIELFGARLPAEVIARVGALLLVLCQLYLWIHLEQLALWLSAVPVDTWPTGYVAVYQTSAAFRLSVISASALPVITLLGQALAEAYVNRRLTSLLVAGVPMKEANLFDWSVFLLTIVVSSFLSVVIFRSLRSIQLSALEHHKTEASIGEVAS